ncbi:MAG TPA: gamma carbonic anhydrase family protein [Bryobacteraceae bacterium]|nr:gamma carbonic anhydrase family protein [Bryobacteraceae bacterium]
MLRKFRGISPRVAASAYVDPAATVIGDVVIGERSSVWPGATLRGDIDPIRVGEETSIQEGVVVHTDSGFPTAIGNRVTIGHSAVIHGCAIEDEALIGIGAIVLNGARVGKGAVVAAGSLVTEGMQVPPATLVMGAPAKPRRAVSAEEQARFRKGVQGYVERAALYKERE